MGRVDGVRFVHVPGKLSTDPLGEPPAAPPFSPTASVGGGVEATFDA